MKPGPVDDLGSGSLTSETTNPNYDDADGEGGSEDTVDERAQPHAACEEESGLVYESPTTQIYRAADSMNVLGPPGVVVAIKLLTDPSPDDVACLNNEYTILTRKLPQCHGARRALKQGKQDGFQAIYLEWVDGVTLKEWVESNGGKNLIVRVRVAREICKSLSEIHGSGVMHNDISADNIIVDTGHDDGDGCTVTFIDFGFADTLSSHESTDTGESASDDLFALGSVLHELFTNRFRDEIMRNSITGSYQSLDRLDEGSVPFIGGVPQSISRLLASLMANGDGSIRVNPCGSARDVEDDLDRMFQDPDKYLFDPPDPPEEDDLLSLLDVASNAPETATIDRAPDKDDDRQSAEMVLVAAYSGKSSLMNLAMEMVRQPQDVEDRTEITHGILERLSVDNSFDFVWLTSSNALADSLPGLADNMKPNTWLLSIFFGDPSNSEGPSMLSRAKAFLWGESMSENNELVALFLDPASEFDPSTFRSRVCGSVGTFVIQRRAVS